MYEPMDGQDAITRSGHRAERVTRLPGPSFCYFVAGHLLACDPFGRAAFAAIRHPFDLVGPWRDPAPPAARIPGLRARAEEVLSKARREIQAWRVADRQVVEDVVREMNRKIEELHRVQIAPAQTAVLDLSDALDNLRADIAARQYDGKG